MSNRITHRIRTLAMAGLMMFALGAVVINHIDTAGVTRPPAAAG